MNKVKPAQLHEYPEYLPSGETRIRAIPEHWDVSKLKHCLKVNESTLPETTDPDAEFRYIEIGAVESGDLTEPPRKIQFGTAPSRARRMVKPGDTIVSTVRTYLKAVWYADDPGDDLICSTGFAVLTPREGTIPKFASYVALSAPFTDQVTAESVGIAYPAISEKKLSDLTIMVPPPDEQAAIVRYLDHVDEQIQRYIAAKERLIALLEEERQALVHQAVTRGLDPNVRLKPSGVEWLGKVPEHWEVARFARQVNIAEGQVDPKIEPYASMLMIAPNHVESGTGRLLSRETASEQGAISGKYFCRAGDVVYSKIRPALAKVSVAPTDCLCSADMYPLRPRNSLQSDYLFWLLLSRGFTAWSVLQSDRVAMPKINRQTLNNVHIPLPPLSEQASIVQHLIEATSKASSAIDRAHSQIDLMNEYRTRLIADVVTGQLDAREAAAQLQEAPWATPSRTELRHK